MAIIVQKYGGTSVGSAERIQNVAKRIKKTRQKGNKVVVVVSAMGDSTDHLIDLVNQLTQSPSPREYDMVVSTGEQVSAGLLAMALHELGEEAISLTGYQAGVQTETKHQKARIIGVDAARMKKELKKHDVIVVTGFQGFTEDMNIATIGRGGSDTSAVVLAAALKAKECEIYTDVKGVYTTDPRIEKKAKKIKTISYEEMLEMASLGAKVLHPRAVECAKENNVVLHVRSSFYDEEGTLVKEVSRMERKKAVSGVTLDDNTAKIGVLKVSDKPGVAAKLFNSLAKANINVDMIIQSIHGDNVADIAFTICRDDLNKSVEIAKAFGKTIKAKGVVADDNVAKVSIVGVGMISAPGVAATMFSTLADSGINIHMISTSEIKISCIVDMDKAKKAVQLLHKAFKL